MAVNNITIAVADDHAGVRNATVSLLEEQGFTVTIAAANGKELIQKLHTSPLPQICVVDLRMSDMSGFETTQYIKTTWSTVKVMMFSFHDQAVYRKKAMLHGADSFTGKFDGIDSLITAVKEMSGS